MIELKKSVPVVADVDVLIVEADIAGAAALSARANVTPRELDVKELQSLLYNEYQAPLGDEERLKELGII